MFRCVDSGKDSAKKWMIYLFRSSLRGLSRLVDLWLEALKGIELRVEFVSLRYLL